LQVPEVYLLEGKKVVKISKSEVEKIRVKRKVALMKFLKGDRIGILVSTKPGQAQLDKAIGLKKRFLKEGKEAWIFVCDNVDVGQFENFNIDSWVNTSCSGLANDNSDVVNFNELP
jgi:2-(3-amino-3-carboxypropyl)histidine synthase